MSDVPNDRIEQVTANPTYPGASTSESTAGGPEASAPMNPMEQSPTRISPDTFSNAAPPADDVPGPAPTVPEPVPEAPPMQESITAATEASVIMSGESPAAHVQPETSADLKPAFQPAQAGAPEPAGELAVSPEAPASEGTVAAEGVSESLTTPQAPPAPAPPQVQHGKITRVTPEQVWIVLEDGQYGYVPLIEFAAQPLPRVGDDIHVIIDRPDEKTGELIFSKRQADEFTFWQSVQPGDILEGVVTGMNKGGLDVDIGGARAFLPASQVDMRRLHDISVLIGEHVRCVVSQVDRTTQDLVLSRRKLQEIEKQEQRKQAVEQILEGEIRTGKVSNVTEFGAFVNIGGVDALLHMSDMCWGRVRPPAEVVKKGQELTVKVLKVDRVNGKVSVGLKQAKPNPWDNIQEKYPEGGRIKGTVARFADFGAFLELEDGVDALLPVSELSWTRRINHPADVLKEGEEREVVVLKVDPAKRRISVGLRQAEPNPWDNIEQLFPINSTVKGRVTKIMEYGAFVDIGSGIEGLVHISALSDRRVKSVGDVVKEGQEVDVRIIKTDKEAQRVSLSMRPEAAPRPGKPEDAARQPGKEPSKKKERPLRGGLSAHFDWMGSGLKGLPRKG